jgi:hypothetical protein
MHNVHGFALISEALKPPAASVMAVLCEVHATALKAMHKAGRRGGDSIAREADNMYVADCISSFVKFRCWQHISEAYK